MVNDATQQFVYRAVIITVCAITGAIFIFLFIAAVKLGDGEAIRIIDAMTPLAVSCIGAMVTTVLGGHAAGAFMASQLTRVSVAKIQAEPSLATANAAATVATANAGAAS